uniref:Candidate secreted effector n=1 Tax=Meloidogyne incognita TaxID=6306 RepID=A0A914N7G6_MELIC
MPIISRYTSRASWTGIANWPWPVAARKTSLPGSPIGPAMPISPGGPGKPTGPDGPFVPATPERPGMPGVLKI